MVESVAPSGAVSRRRKMAPSLHLKPWQLKRLQFMLVILVCTLWILYKSEVFVATECLIYGSPIYSEIGDSLSPPLASYSLKGETLPWQRVLESRFKITNSGDLWHTIPVNGEYCSRCNAIQEDTRKVTSAIAPAQHLEAFHDQQVEAYLQQKQQILDVAVADNSNKNSDPLINKKSSSCRAPKSTETVPALKRIKLLHSRKPRLEHAVTIVTQLSLERMQMLEHQCSLWPHPIAAAFYIPLVQGKVFSAESSKWEGAALEEALAALAAMHAVLDDINADKSCILDLDVVVEEVCTPEKALDYPVNALRNRALILAHTELVLLLDVDFIVDQDLARTVEDPKLFTELVGMLSQGAAIVLPAFETADEGDAGVELAVQAVQQGKSYLVPHLKINYAFPFHGCYFPVGQGATESLHWIKNSTTQPYRIFYEEYYEPYLLMKKSSVPFYDERFTGRHRNKMQHIAHVAVQSKLALIVHPRHFVIHLPHKRSFAAEHAHRGGKLGGVDHKHKMEGYYQEAVVEMEATQFAPVTTFSHLCLPDANKLRPAETGVGVLGGEMDNPSFKLPEFVDYFEEGVGEYWDCNS
ncbi:hypothetical protein Ndes2437B_g01296 [Nannochloris sp. 'desiccata']